MANGSRQVIERIDLGGEPAAEELMALLSGDRVGKSVKVRILRGGEVRDVNVTVGERG